MNQREQQLTNDIMRRVRLIHTMRYLLTPSMVKALVFLASCVSVLLLVSISHCIENMSHLPNVMAYANYIAGAYVQTSFAVQAIIALALAAGIWLVRDIISGWSMQRSFARS